MSLPENVGVPKASDEAEADMYMEDEHAMIAGLLDPDQPTRYSTYRYHRRLRERAEKPLTPAERWAIRMLLHGEIENEDQGDQS